MEKTLKVYKDEILDAVTREINRCHEQAGKSLADRRTLIAGAFEEVRDNLILVRNIISKIPFEVEKKEPVGEVADTQEKATKKEGENPPAEKV